MIDLENVIRILLATALFLLVGACERDPGGEPEAVEAEAEGEAVPGAVETLSEFGAYQGYSELLFSDWVRQSQYVTVRDGTKLAVDIVRPAVNGVPVEEPLPVVWTHSRYHRNPDAFVRMSIQDALDAAEKAGEEPTDVPEPPLR